MLYAGIITLAGFLFFAGLYYLGSFRNQFMSRSTHAIFAISEIKASQIKTWREDRLKDAFFIRTNSGLTFWINRLHENPNNTWARSRVEAILSSLREYHPYQFFVLAPDGNQILQWPKDVEPLEFSHYEKYVPLDTLKTGFVEFYKNTRLDKFFLGMVVHVASDQPNGHFTIAIRVDPYYGLYNKFAISYSKNMEVQTYLLIRHNNELYTFSDSTSIRKGDLFTPLTQSQKMGVLTKLLNDNSGIVTGKGLNGQTVFAALAEIPGTPWLVLGEFDENELLYAIKQRILAISLLGGGFLLSLLGLLLVFGRQQELRLIRISRENELTLDDLINNQPSGIYRLVFYPSKFDDNDFSNGEIPEIVPMEYLFTSRQHETITGLSEEALSNNASLIISIIYDEDRKNFIAEYRIALQRMNKFIWEGRIVVSGRIKWVKFESIPRLNPPNQIIWTGVIIDISDQKRLEKEMERLESFERMLTHLSSSFVSASPARANQVLESALHKIGEFCLADRAYIFQNDESKQIIINSHEWCDDGIEPQKQFLQALPYYAIPKWMELMTSLMPVNIYDVNSLPDEWKLEKQLFRQQSIKSLVAVPLIAEGKNYGFVGFDYVKTHFRWNEADVQILRVFADMVYNTLQKVRSEQQLVESRAMLRSVLDTIKVRVFWKDSSLVFRGCNIAFANDAGFENPDQVIGLNDFQMIWKEYATKYQADDRKVIKLKQPVLNIIEQQRSPKGEIRWINTSKIPLINQSGEITGVLGTYQDITRQREAEIALKNSEKTHRVLTENAFDGIYMLQNMRFEYVNQRFCELTGYSFNELTHANFDIKKLFTPETRSVVDQRKRARIDGIPIPSTYEMQIITKQGIIKDVEISTNQVSNPGEELVILGIMRDITERKVNEKLRTEVEIANQSSVFKQNFLANMSHEIRTPLTGVLGMIEVLSSTELNSQQADYVNTLKLSTENLREIINQILDYSKIEAGEVHLKNAVIETRLIFEKAHKLFEANCKKDVVFNLDIDPSIPEKIETDEHRLTQIINNLVSNAIKFTNKGYITIKAEVLQWINDRDLYLQITVTDTGIGISQQSTEKLFKPFGQVDYEDKRHFDGTGLGLSICKELVTLMGGEISVVSSEGKGSSFRFSFRTRKAIIDEKTKTNPDSVGTKASRSLNILFAEDKLVNQKVVGLLLTSLGHHVTFANNGIEVIEKFLPETFDLILMDIQMPVMDGITATQKLREKYSVLPPVVGLSANAFEGDREKYMLQGMDEYLTKPVNRDDLQFMIAKLVAKV